MTLPKLYRPSPNVVAVFRWIGLALLGIVVAAVVSIAASRLASQQIGLASQPVSAGDALAPAAERKAGRVEHRRAHARAKRQRRGGTQRPAEPAPQPEEPEEAIAPVSPAPEAQLRRAPSPAQPAEPGAGEDGESNAGPDD